MPKKNQTEEIKTTLQLVHHELEPIYDYGSRVLILGTMPSPKSREEGFYYAHPQNRLWRVLSELMGETLPVSTAEKKAFLRRHHIAMWDVLKSCRIKGADDSSISGAEPNDINSILSASNIRAVFTTGKKATDLYQRLCYPITGVPSRYLPSTSPANCRNCTLETLKDDYRIILDYL
ncbi:DNA-deoxyinosine glycosylase [Anoxybacterium hadale]|uniref:DNA-deoxyinosine glycosylase n=1 Tax=Anoxybacterium hadale TaxID=3408580 RepID=A0ACD1A719_9FIRM|nr:DNA-deoxyinosine glycosylase [Clostridiales bacterium]